MRSDGRPDACFFCGRVVNEKVSREHIFGDSFLAYIGLKQEKVTSSQRHPTSYSKIKVPSHKTCNERGGSEIENYVLSIVRTMDSNPNHLAALHTFTEDPVNKALREAFTQWLAKLYFGLLYWEAGLKKHADPAHQQWLRSLLDCPEFAYLRRCFTERLPFKLPSSLFYFRVPDPREAALRFDFADGLPHGLFYIRFRNHLLITALGDANLVHEWFTPEHARAVQLSIDQLSPDDPVAYLHAVAHIWAVREWLPVQPRLEFENSYIRDRSRDEYTERSPIDSGAVNARAAEIFDEHAARWNKATA